MRSGLNRRRATGIRSTGATPTRQGLLRGLAVASIVGVGAVTGLGAAGMGPLAALAGDAGLAEHPAEPELASPAPSDGGGAQTPTESPSTPTPAETTPEETPTETETSPAEDAGGYRAEQYEPNEVNGNAFGMPDRSRDARCAHSA